MESTKPTSAPPDSIFSCRHCGLTFPRRRLLVGHLFQAHRPTRDIRAAQAANRTAKQPAHPASAQAANPGYLTTDQAALEQAAQQALRRLAQARIQEALILFWALARCSGKAARLPDPSQLLNIRNGGAYREPYPTDLAQSLSALLLSGFDGTLSPQPWPPPRPLPWPDAPH